MSEAFRLVLNAEKAVPELAIALLTIDDVVATSCVALEGIKGAMQDAGHAFSAIKHGAKAGLGTADRHSPRNHRAISTAGCSPGGSALPLDGGLFCPSTAGLPISGAGDDGCTPREPSSPRRMARAAGGDQHHRRPILLHCGSGFGWTRTAAKTASRPSLDPEGTHFSMAISSLFGHLHDLLAEGSTFVDDVEDHVDPWLSGLVGRSRSTPKAGQRGPSTAGRRGTRRSRGQPRPAAAESPGRPRPRESQASPRALAWRGGTSRWRCDRACG